MKTKKIKRLLRKTAKRNGLEIDLITGQGFDDIDLYAKHPNGASLLLRAERSSSGKVESIGYLNYGFSLYDTSDDLFVNVEVRNFKKFLKNIDGHLDYYVTPQNMDNIAEIIDELPGTAPGNFSTYINLGMGEASAFA